MSVSMKDREYLRELAKKQLEYASMPINKERERLWYEHNDLKGKFPMVTMEEWTFYDDVYRELVCESEEARNLEYSLMYNIIAHEDIDDDRVIPGTYDIGHSFWFTPFNLSEQRESSETTESIGFHIVPIIEDLEQDFHKLQKSTWGFDTKSAKAQMEFVGDIFGDIIPPRLVGQAPGIGLTYRLVALMSMENLLVSLYDYPELVHKMLTMMTDDILEYFKDLENNNVLIVNNGNNAIGQGTVSFTNDLPSKAPGEKVLMKDVWGFMDSQETVGVGPEMFNEFFFPYYKRIGDEFGLLNYGCCEAVHPLWDLCLSKFSNLRKISISPWCDEEFMGERLRGSNVMFHRKPSPNFIGGTNPVLDEEAFSEHIKKTCIAARGCKLEFSFRDIYTIHKDLTKPKRAIAIVKNMIEKYWY